MRDFGALSCPCWGFRKVFEKKGRDLLSGTQTALHTNKKPKQLTEWTSRDSLSSVFNDRSFQRSCSLLQIGKSQRVKMQRVRTSENFAEEQKCLPKMFHKTFSEERRDHIYWNFIVFLDLRNILCRNAPRAKFLAKYFTGMGEKCGRNLAKNFADFRASISRKFGRKKLQEKSLANSTSHEIRFFHRERLWELVGTKIFAEDCLLLPDNPHPLN